MMAGEREYGLSRMFCLTGNSVQEQGPAGDGLVVLAGGKTDEKRPPVVNKGDHPARQTAALEIMGGVASPSPLVLQFVKAVLHIGSVSVELGYGKNFI